jgi:hypothetical protein
MYIILFFIFIILLFIFSIYLINPSQFKIENNKLTLYILAFINISILIFFIYYYYLIKRKSYGLIGIKGDDGLNGENGNNFIYKDPDNIS